MYRVRNTCGYIECRPSAYNHEQFDGKRSSCVVAIEPMWCWRFCFVICTRTWTRRYSVRSKLVVAASENIERGRSCSFQDTKRWRAKCQVASRHVQSPRTVGGQIPMFGSACRPRRRVMRCRVKLVGDNGSRERDSHAH